MSITEPQPAAPPAAEPPAVSAVKAGDLAQLEAALAADRSAVHQRDSAGVSVLLLACYHRRQDMVQRLLDERPLLDIFEASATGQASRVSELADRDPGLVRAISADGFTPLHLAAFFDHPGVARRLLRRGADPRAVARNDSRVSLLHSALAAGSYAVARMLLDAGAPPDARQAGGWTPLHAAASSGNRQLVELLLEHGASRDIAAEDGRTARDLATEKGHGQLARMLRA
jgi:uncharacterized protein